MTKTTELPTRRLGRTDMEISRVGFGAWAIGMRNWGTQNDSDSIAAIHRAVQLGVNWIDTAAVYGRGHSERVIGRALAELPASDRPHVFTKCVQLWDPDDDKVPVQRVHRPESIRRELEDSLRRLGVDAIDLFQIHWPATDGTPIEEYWGTMLEFKKEGKVRAVGLSNHDTEALARAEAVGHVDTLQPPFSAIRRDAALSEIPWCTAHGTGVICYSPMQSGLLTGAFTVERAAALKSDDWRHRSPDHTGEALHRNLRLSDALQPIADRRGTTRAAVAVAWALAWPGITGAIVGGRSPAQVDGWVDAAALALSESEMREIGDAIAGTGAGSGPLLPQAA